MAGDPVNINEFQELARQALPKMYYDYYTGGAEDEHTLRENVEAFQRITFQPRILVDVSNVDVSSSILGYNVSVPIMIAPTGMHKLAHPKGEMATARAAAACNTIMVLSFSSNCTIEEVASSCNAIRFYQLYAYQRRDVSAKLVQRAQQNGFKAIVLTADAPKSGRRERDIKNKMVVPKLKNLEGLLSVEVDSEGGSKFEAFTSRTRDPSLNWKDIGWLKSITTLPILIKGVLTAEDGNIVHGRAGKVIFSIDFAARMAVDVGAAGVIVSNHGARQLDYVPASISVLEEIGRPVIYGLAAKGEHGARQVIEMLRNELELTMSLNGCRSIKDITRSYVRTEHERLRSSL
ncbi:peroxisomal (S)-2-hydroxyacid oxidase GLO4-like isoform X4 [Magnolia sinica]|uniref:peroxisomal (S)-2-hydroxyacid oxidase GLO4-like isoform X4 n=1 Tax=Magnolia sinica TaxID=86752 RepID=UPI00265A3D5A|nr:peroxisomal (S)-2-hydroxyacid oxidase GLO4-like isoform X4 [Magnolia sinica]